MQHPWDRTDLPLRHTCRGNECTQCFVISSPGCSAPPRGFPSLLAPTESTDLTLPTAPSSQGGQHLPAGPEGAREEMRRAQQGRRPALGHTWGAMASPRAARAVHSCPCAPPSIAQPRPFVSLPRQTRSAPAPRVWQQGRQPGPPGAGSCEPTPGTPAPCTAATV